MSDILFIVPSHWVEIPNTQDWIGPVIDITEVSHKLAQEAWDEFTNLFRGMGVIPADKVVKSARLITTLGGYRFFVEFV
jgi:hypothetical protein